VFDNDSKMDELLKKYEQKQYECNRLR